MKRMDKIHDIHIVTDIFWNVFSIRMSVEQVELILKNKDRKEDEPFLLEINVQEGDREYINYILCPYTSDGTLPFVKQ